jgi:hypothetical protein
MKLRRPQENLFGKKPDFIMRVAGEPLESVAAVKHRTQSRAVGIRADTPPTKNDEYTAGLES